MKISPAPEGRKTMAPTFANLLAYAIFSIKNWEAWITPDLKAELLRFGITSVAPYRG